MTCPTGRRTVASELLAKNGVLGAQVVHHQLLLPVGIAGLDAGEQVQRL
jgi:hypothetical protein